jgi:hypothetical protein
MSIFQEMFDQETFSWPDQYDELLRKLSEAIERGFVEEIPNTRTGIYRHSRWFPDTGSWDELTPKQMFPDATIAPMGRLPN